MKDLIVFSTKDTNSLYKLFLGKSIIHFIEFDFTYFWEQCIDTGKASKIMRNYSLEQAHILKNIIIRCHPYYEALINNDFDQISLDCIIEYICRSEGIGLEELWTMCISPKNNYEKAIFSRISDYKSNKAINQWVNLIRLQEYAKKKLDFIFEGENTSNENIETYIARKEYFDMTFSVVAKELGYPSEELPGVKYYSTALMPHAPFLISKVSKPILKEVYHKIANADIYKYNKNNRTSDSIHDQNAMDAFSFISDIKRPTDLEVASTIEVLKKLPQEVYVPDSLKAIIDLEINKMLERNIILQKCISCGRYFIKDETYSGEYCDKVTSNGKSCRENYAEKMMATAVDAPIFEEYEPSEMSPELEKRCQQMYNSLYKKLGKNISETDFKEWSSYLTSMKKNIKNSYSTPAELEAFLDYTESTYGEIRQKGRPKKSNDIIE